MIYILIILLGYFLYVLPGLYRKSRWDNLMKVTIEVQRTCMTSVTEVNMLVPASFIAKGSGKRLVLAVIRNDAFLTSYLDHLQNPRAMDISRKYDIVRKQLIQIGVVTK